MKPARTLIMATPYLLALPLLFSAIWFYALSHATPPPAGKTIWLLIAHPDDEAMFFAPTLLALSAHNTLGVLCLSSGDADGLGAVRKTELVESCRRLGVATERVHVVEHPELRDSMTVTWDSGRIAEEAGRVMGGVDVVVTFDRGGVSGHPNHVSLLAGAKRYLAGLREQGGKRVELRTLRTVGLARKYSFVVDALWTVWGAGGEAGRWVFVSTMEGVRTAQRAMTQAHVSQMRWFRWGWIGLSRYMVVNDLVEEQY